MAQHLFAVLFLLTAAAAQAPLAVEITVKDKPPLAATWAPPALVVDTEFGSATIKPERLEQILFGDPDVVVAAGVELRGKLKLSGVEAKVDGKARRFAPKELESLVVVRDGAAGGAGAASFTGDWITSWGPARLQQRGLRVTGTYGHDGKGEIEGKLERNALQFEWRNNGRNGKGSVELLAKDGAFLGKVGDDDSWGGYRKAPQRAAAKPGEVGSGQTDAGLRYHVRLPKAHADGAKWPAVCILHGSNMDSRAYVDTIVGAWPELAEQYVVVGFDGENLSPASKAGALRFNYQYINFSGPKVGPVWMHRQSPALVADSLEQLQKELPVTKWFLGGHSQGGFLTWCLVMFYPQLLAGAFPMSCNLLVQCEPDNFDAEKAKAQHGVAVAVIHGRADDVVPFSGGAYCHLRAVDAAFPCLRLFAPERIGHQFALLPVDEAVRWLAACAADDAEVRLRAAEGAAADSRWRDVGALLQRIEAGSPPPALRARADALAKKLDERAQPGAAKLAKAIAKDDGGRWIDEFLTWRVEFATAPCAVGVLDAYAELRRAQAKAADDLFGEWRGSRDKSARQAIFEKVSKNCFASKWYEAMRLWMK
ncbi:MAG TPA: alpha/beta fold hydrolase [Planctomycetota bacterium]